MTSPDTATPAPTTQPTPLGMEAGSSPAATDQAAGVPSSVPSPLNGEGQRLGKIMAVGEQLAGHAALRRAEQGLARAARLNASEQQRLDARLAVLRALADYRRAYGLAKEPALHAFAADYNAGRILCDDLTKMIYERVSAGSLRRWLDQARRDGVARLAGRYGNRRGDTIIDRQPAMAEFITGMLAEFPHTTSKNIYHAVQARFGREGMVPVFATLNRWVQRWKAENAQLFAALTSPDKWKSRYMMAAGDAGAHVSRLNQEWELDSTPCDMLLVDGRHAIIGVIDVYSRRLTLHVSRTSKASAIALCARRALLAWGVPETVKHDNGQDYISRHLTRVWTGLEVAQSICDPFSPWQKPHIERAFRTVLHSLVELLAGYIGHNVAERKAIEDRKSFADRLMQRGSTLELRMEADQLQDFLDRWCQYFYEQEPHSGLGGATPFAVAAEWREPVRRIGDERALDVLLAEAPGGDGLRTVGKKGIRIDRFEYIHDELGFYVGQTVRVLYDPSDLGRVYVFGGPEQDFICVAECPEFLGVDRGEVAARARAKQKADVQAARAAIKAAARKLKVKDVAEEILAARREATNVYALPRPGTDHETPALTAAQRALETPAAPTYSDADAEAQQRLITDMNADVRDLPEDPRATYERWVRIDRRIRAGNLVVAAERDFWRSYGESPERLSMQQFYEDFGLQVAE